MESTFSACIFGLLRPLGVDLEESSWADHPPARWMASKLPPRLNRTLANKCREGVGITRI